MTFRFQDPASDFEGADFLYDDGKEEASIFKAAAESQGLADFAGKQLKAHAMGAALTWVDEKDYSFDALAALAQGLADIDGDGEVSDDEEALYNDLLGATGGALVALGADADAVQDFMNGEEDDAGGKIGKALAKKMDSVELDDDEIVNRHTLGSDSIFEATQKVMRGGKVVLRRKPTRKVRLNAAQRAALKKARRKSNTAAARKNRARTMKKRKSRGL